MDENDMAEYLSQNDIPMSVSQLTSLQNKVKHESVDFSGASDKNDGYANER